MPEVSAKANTMLNRVKLTLFFLPVLLQIGLFSNLCLALTPANAAELPVLSATASTSRSPFLGSKTIDNNFSTFWQGLGYQPYWWLKLDLGKTSDLSQVSVWWNRKYGSTNYDIRTSIDGTNWTNQWSALSTTTSAANPRTYNLTGPARYVMLYIKTAQRDAPIIYELKLYGAQASSDTTPPQVSISSPLNNATVSATQEIKAEATDNIGLSKVEFYLDNSLLFQDTASPYTYSWDTSTSSNGSHTLKVIAYDSSNNQAQAQLTVNVNNTTPPPPPASGQLTIQSAEASSSANTYYTAAKTIDNSLSTFWQGLGYQPYWWLKLDLGKTSDLSQVSIWWNNTYGSTNYDIRTSTDGAVWTNQYTSLSTTGSTTNPRSYNLTGTARYVMLYINKARAYSPIIYELKLYGASADIPPPDTTPPTGSISINNNATYANSTAVTLNLSAQDNTGGSGMGAGAQMQFSNDSANWSIPEPYTATKSWSLAAGDGAKTVYVKYKDAAGNWSQAYSDTIILDTTPVLSINPVTSPTNQEVRLYYSVTDNLTPAGQIIITGDNSPYTSEGAYNVSLTAKDLAGNSSTSSISFTIDKTAPIIIITSPKNGTIVEDSPIQLQGTVDGLSFSEERTLIEGENTLSRTSTDLAGNTSTAFITVTYYPSTLITPEEGGTVSSYDRKIKLVIPPGALLQATRILLLNLNLQSFQDDLPQQTTLLKVVEAKPYGLLFYKPCQLTITLDNAEVPGTQVELALYNSLEDKIESTGDKTQVSPDSYTLNYSINHFSTYAAIKSLISQSTPIGAGVKIPLPDLLTGSFSHSIPLTVPPGRKGMQPAIALSYRSSNSNSWLGLGFSLNPGYIVRSTRLGPPKYIDTEDTFYFVTDAGSTELVWLTDNLYQAKVESSFAKFFKEQDDSWKVLGKDGSILTFGKTLDSKESSVSGTFSWHLTRAVDNNGNYIEYGYSKDQGKAYLSCIDYTGNEIGVSPVNSVQFILEARDDIPSSYISTSKIATAKRLKEIQVKQGSDLVWRYVLEYNYSQDTNRSLLKSITQYAGDDKSLPAQRFSYQKAK